MPFTPDQVLFLDEDNIYGADELGLPYRDIVSEGVVGSGDFAVSERAAGANMSVDVAAGQCWIKGDDNATLQPTYRYREAAVTNLAISAADPTNPRKDIVVAEILDATFAGVSKLGRLRAITGTPAGAPVEPALPNNALKLALIDIPALDTAITNSQITDSRIRSGFGNRALIHDKILTASAASIDLPNIPASFAHLELIVYARGDAGVAAVTVKLQFNGDTGNNYSAQVFFANGTTITGAEDIGVSSMRVGRVPAGTAIANSFGCASVQIPNYAQATNHKAVTGASASRDSAAAGAMFIEYDGGVWFGTPTAINRIVVLPSTGNFVAGTRVTLYGLRA